MTFSAIGNVVKINEDRPAGDAASDSIGQSSGNTAIEGKDPRAKHTRPDT